MSSAAIAVPPHVRALLFDCDGTLVDTMPLHWQAWLETLREFGIEISLEFIAAYRGATVEDIVAAVSRATGREIDLAAFVPRKQGRFRELLPGVREIALVADLVRAHHGRLPMAIVSGGCRRNVTASLEATSLARYFPVVLTSDDPFPGKPAPDILLEAARRLGVPPAHCQVFEDGDLGLEAARAAGMLATDVRPWIGEPERPSPAAARRNRTAHRTP
jgi:beta-phosphoglucomutase-like phosphatase (HAD superfamily)